jgi:midasin
MTFSYVKGVMSEAVEQGHWLLVDEINLASAECLDALAELLEPNIEGSPGTRIHPDFRLFSCMNNATDIGKRSLPSGIRSKFTEFCVLETTDCNQLRTFIHGQIPSLNKELVDAILNFYIEVSAYFPKKFRLIYVI